MKKSKFIAFIFSFVPGAGHMYLGYMNMGVQIMFAFFGSIYISDLVLNGTLSILFIPIIWFYGVFDVLRKTDVINNAKDYDVDKDVNFPIFDWLLGDKSNYSNKIVLLGIAFIVFGAVIILDKMLLPLINVVVLDYAKTIIIAAILIGIGLRFIFKNKKKM